MPRIELFIDFVGSYGRGVTRGIMKYAHSIPGVSVVAGPGWNFQRPFFSLYSEIDGLIIQSMRPEIDQQIRGYGLPCINMSNIMPSCSFPTVVPDDAGIGRMAAAYLLEKGFTSLGYYGPLDTGYGQTRAKAFKQVVEDAGAACAVCDSCNEKKLGEFVKSFPQPYAIFGASDHWAHQVLEACHQNHIAVPEGAAVLGVDDDELFNAMVTPSLSSIRLPLERIGFQSAFELNQLTQKRRQPPTLTTFSPLEVVERQSTNIVAINDVDVASALQFIRLNVSKSISVDDVLDVVPLGRRSLERRVRSTIGRSIYSEIIRSRIELAKRLLISTDLPMSRIAENAGFSNATQFALVFRKEVNRTPTEYRCLLRVPSQRQNTAVAIR